MLASKDKVKYGIGIYQYYTSYSGGGLAEQEGEFRAEDGGQRGG